MDSDTLQELYLWVDGIPLSRPKNHINRDFSDGGKSLVFIFFFSKSTTNVFLITTRTRATVMMAELIKHFRPKLVEMHNYSAANSSKKKKYNWMTLRKKVFPKLKITISDTDVSRIVMSKPGAVEDLLLQVKNNINKRRKKRSSPYQKPQIEEKSLSNVEEEYDVSRVSNISTNSRCIIEEPVVPYDTSALQREVDTEILVEKEQTIQELRETVDILDQKIKKLEQLVRLKDSKIDTLRLKLRQNGL
jgi:hypothetical protein